MATKMSVSYLPEPVKMYLTGLRELCRWDSGKKMGRLRSEEEEIILDHPNAITRVLKRGRLESQGQRSWQDGSKDLNDTK